jgi:hypothetical protein
MRLLSSPSSSRACLASALQASAALLFVPVFVAVLGASSAARAQLAVVTTLPEPDPGQRDVAAGIVAVAGERWQLLSPPLDPDVTAACKTDTACMLAAARAKGATHLLVVSVAGVGRRDHVVALQVLDGTGRVLLDNTAIVAGGGAPVDVGAAAAAPLARIDGPPRAPTRPAAVTATTTATGTTTTSAWTVAGVALVAAGAATAAATTLATTTGAVPDDDAVVVNVIGAAAGVTLGALGVLCVVVDDG